MLNVPVAELLVDSHPLSLVPTTQRGAMVRLMKTLTTILNKCQNHPIRCPVQNATAQLVEIMSELQSVGPWHDEGKRRTSKDVGRVGQRVYPDDWGIGYEDHTDFMD